METTTLPDLYRRRVFRNSYFGILDFRISKPLSMVDSLNFTGLIGTWVAVLIVLVALAGVIPVYLLYKGRLPENPLDREK